MYSQKKMAEIGWAKIVYVIIGEFHWFTIIIGRTYINYPAHMLKG